MKTKMYLSVFLMFVFFNLFIYAVVASLISTHNINATCETNKNGYQANGIYLIREDNNEKAIVTVNHTGSGSIFNVNVSNINYLMIDLDDFLPIYEFQLIADLNFSYIDYMRYDDNIHIFFNSTTDMDNIAFLNMEDTPYMIIIDNQQYYNWKYANDNLYMNLSSGEHHIIIVSLNDEIPFTLEQQGVLLGMGVMTLGAVFVLALKIAKKVL